MSSQKTALKPCNRPTYASILLGPEEFGDMVKREAKQLPLLQTSEVRQAFDENRKDGKKSHKAHFNNNSALKKAKEDVQLSIVQDSQNADQSLTPKREDVGFYITVPRQQGQNIAEEQKDPQSGNDIKSPSEIPGKRIRLDQGHEGTRKKQFNEYSSIAAPEKKSSTQVDDDGWQTRKSGSKKARNENKAPQSYRQQNLLPARGGFQRSRSSGSNQGPKDTQKTGTWGRGVRNESRRSTVFYPTNRGGNRQGRGQGSAATFGRPTVERGNSTADRMTEKTLYRSDRMDSEITMVPDVSFAPPGEKVANDKKWYDVQTTPTITAAATIIRRPDLTPPPPPSCGVFSYRDVLAKGLKSPPAPAAYSRGSTPLSAPSFSTTADNSFSVSPALSQTVSSAQVSAPCGANSSSPISVPASLPSESTDSFMARTQSASLVSFSSAQCLHQVPSRSFPPSASSSPASISVTASNSLICSFPTKKNETSPESSLEARDERSVKIDLQSPHRSSNPSLSAKNEDPSKPTSFEVDETPAFLRPTEPEDDQMDNKEDLKEGNSPDALNEERKNAALRKEARLVARAQPESLSVISEEHEKKETASEKLQATSPVDLKLGCSGAGKISYSDALKKSPSLDGSPKNTTRTLTSEARLERTFSSPENGKISTHEKSFSTPKSVVPHDAVNASTANKADSTYEQNLSCSDGLLLPTSNFKQSTSNCSSTYVSPLKVLNLGVSLDMNSEASALQSDTNLSVPPPTPTEESVNESDLQKNCSIGSFAVISSVAKELESQSIKLWQPSNASSPTTSSKLEPETIDGCANVGKIDGFLNATQSTADLQESCDTNNDEAKPSGLTNDSTNEKPTVEKSTDALVLDSSIVCGNIGPHSEINEAFPVRRSQGNIPLTIKSMGNREIFFPDVSQSWNSSNLNSNTETRQVLPQRSKHFRRRDSTEDDQTSQVEKSTENLEKQDSENNSVNDSKRSEVSAQPDPVQEKSIPDNSSSWTMTNIDTSSDIYSGIAAPSLPANDTKAEIAPSPRVTVSPELWKTENSKFALPRSNILNINKTETLPLNILLNNQTTSTILTPTEYYTRSSPTKQSDNFSAVSSMESLPSYSVAKTVTCPSNKELDSFPKLPSVESRQSDFGVNLTTVSKAIVDAPSTSEAATGLASETVRSSTAAAMAADGAAAAQTMHFTHNQTSYLQQQTQTSTSSTMNAAARAELEHPGLQRLPPVNMPHLNYIQSHPPPPPPPSLQYHSPYDPHWSRNFPMDMNQPEWLNVNRYANPDRDFSRPPPPLHAIHPVPQAVNYFNYASPMQAQKDGIFSSYNYPHSPFQPAGYRFQAFPPFVQRPPPLPSHFNSGMFNRPYDTRGSLPHRFSPEYRGQNNFSFTQKQYNDGDRARVPPQIPPHFREEVNSSVLPAYKMSGGGHLPESRFNSRDQRNGNRSISSHHPQDPTLGDFLPRQLDNYRNEKPQQDFGLSHSWKKSYEKKSFGNGRKNYKSEHKDDHYLPVGNADSFRDQEQPGDLRRKNQYKGPASHNDELPKHANKLQLDSKNNFQQADVVKIREREMCAGSASGYQEKYVFPPYQQSNDVYLNHLMPTMMPPVELNLNTVTSPYMDVNKDISGEKQSSGTIVADYSSSHLEKTDYEEQASQVSSQACESLQDFCTGGWKYYNDAISSPSGLRIHQSTYVPYVSPCGPVPPSYLASDVRARVQWLGFPKAHEAYTARINSQRSLRMDVTVVCSKGSAVCCNSDILGTCSSYFYERLVGRTEEYITIFVNIPSKIMKHFLQMMSCGEAFVPMNDVNDVIMRAPVYLNLNL